MKKSVKLQRTLCIAGVLSITASVLLHLSGKATPNLLLLLSLIGAGFGFSAAVISFIVNLFELSVIDHQDLSVQSDTPDKDYE